MAPPHSADHTRAIAQVGVGYVKSNFFLILRLGPFDEIMLVFVYEFSNELNLLLLKLDSKRSFKVFKRMLNTVLG